MRLLTAILLATLAASPGFEILNHQAQVSNDMDCTADGCGLKKVRFEKDDYRVWVVSGWNYGTRMSAEYQTRGVASLADYAFVSFIKGCHFSQRPEDNFHKSFDVVMDHFGKRSIMFFDRPVIDSVDVDPVYNSLEDTRHDLYRWTNEANLFNPQDFKFFGEEKPEQPRLYVTDRPGTAFFMNGVVHNLAFRFKMCMYRTADVPTQANPEDINFGKPLTCFDWDSVFIYNFQTHAFDSSTFNDNLCR